MVHRSTAAPVDVVYEDKNDTQRIYAGVVLKKTNKYYYKMHRVYIDKNAKKTELQYDGGVTVSSSLATSDNSVSTNSISDSSNNATQGKYNKKSFSVDVDSESLDANEIARKAKEYFGTTDNWNEA